MKYFYVISNLSKDYVLDVQDEVQNCLEKRGAVCRRYPVDGQIQKERKEITVSEYFFFFCEFICFYLPPNSRIDKYNLFGHHT